AAAMRRTSTEPAIAPRLHRQSQDRSAPELPTALARLGSAMTRPPPLYLVRAYVRSGGRREMHDAIQDGGRGPPEQWAAELRAARSWLRRAVVPDLVLRRCEATPGVLRHRRDAARSPLRVQRGGWLDVIVRSSKSVPLDQLARRAPIKAAST